MSHDIFDKKDRKKHFNYVKNRKRFVWVCGRPLLAEVKVKLLSVIVVSCFMNHLVLNHTFINTSLVQFENK